MSVSFVRVLNLKSAPKRLDKVEQLARMIKQQAEQAEQAQFTVVSLRRLMIESAQHSTAQHSTA